MNLESSLLRYFREVYRLKSIRQASATLNVAPSAVSRQILRLEQMVGVPLFERLPRGVAPTKAAEVLARFSRSFLTDIERVRGEIDSLRGLRRGHIRIMSTEGLVAYLLNRTIASFHHRFPGITYELAIVGTDAVAPCLRSPRDGSAAGSGECNGRALTKERAYNSASDASGSARDQGHLVLQSLHDTCPRQPWIV